MSRSSSAHRGGSGWWNEKKGAALFVALLVVFIVYSSSHTNNVWGDAPASKRAKSAVERPASGPDAAYQTFSAQLRGGGDEQQYKALSHDKEQKKSAPSPVVEEEVEGVDLSEVDAPPVEVAEGMVGEGEGSTEAEESQQEEEQVEAEEAGDGEEEGGQSGEEEEGGELVFQRPSWLADPDQPGPRKRVVVVTWTDMTNWVFWYDFDNDKKAREQCSTECVFTNDRNMLGEAQGVVFHHLTHDGSFPDSKPAGQKWIWTNRESPLRCKGPTWDPNFISKFDYSSTYELDSSIPLLYSPHLEGADYYHSGVPLLSFEEKDGYGSPGAAAVFFSHCHGDGAERRRDYVNELMQHMDVHSYGKCLHNRDEPGEVQGLANWREKKWKILQRYKFYLGFDSVVSKDYITEKIYDGLLGGSLPIYFGAKSIDKIMPDPHAYIKVDDFEGPKQLAEFLKTLAANETLYNEYFAWKKRPPSEQFTWVVDHSGERFTSMCIICDRVARNETIEPLTHLMTPVEVATQGR